MKVEETLDGTRKYEMDTQSPLRPDVKMRFMISMRCDRCSRVTSIWVETPRWTYSTDLECQNCHAINPLEVRARVNPR